MARRIALLLLVVLVAVLAWWWLDSREGMAPGGAVATVGRPDTPSGAVPATASPHPVSPDSEAPAPHLKGTGAETDATRDGAGVTLRCRVLDPDGEPPLRCAVLLERRDLVGADRQRFVEVRRVWADALGVATFSELAPGTYHVAALAPVGLLPDHQLVELASTDLEITLAHRRSSDVRVVVVDSDGEPVPKAVVALTRGVVSRARRTDARGVAVLTDVDPDWDIGLRVHPPRNLDLFEKEVDPWAFQDTRVVLERSLNVSLRVVDDLGEPVAKARVHLQVAPGSWEVHTAGGDGRYRFRKLRPGEVVTFQVGPPGSGVGTSGAPRTVEAGTEDLEVVLERGATLDVVLPDWPAHTRGDLRVTKLRDPSASVEVSIGRSFLSRTFRFLDPGEAYVLWGTVRGDERFLYRAEVRPQADPVELRLEEGEGIRVRVKVPAGVVLRSVFAYGNGVRRHALLLESPDGTYHVPALPPGRWTVQALGTPAAGIDGPLRLQEPLTAEKQAQPGDTVELELERVEDE